MFHSAKPSVPSTAVARDKIDLTQLKQLMTESQHYAEELRDKTAIMVCGNTGVGKSVMINLVAGGGVKQVVIKGVKKLDACQSSTIEIGHTTKSTTQFLKGVSLPENSNIVLCDTPGFFENRGETEKICSAKNIKLAIEYAKTISGFVVVIRYNDLLSSRSKELTDFIGEFTENFGKITELGLDKTKVIFVISHFRPSDDPPENKETILAVLRQLKFELAANAEKATLLEMVKLIEENNLFVICNDASGYVPGKSDRVKQEELKKEIIGALPKKTEIEKTHFALCQTTGKLSKKLLESDACVELDRLSNCRPITGPNISPSFVSLHKIVADTAEFYLSAYQGRLDKTNAVKSSLAETVFASIASKNFFSDEQEFIFFQQLLANINTIINLLPRLGMDSEAKNLEAIRNKIITENQRIYRFITEANQKIIQAIQENIDFSIRVTSLSLKQTVEEIKKTQYQQEQMNIEHHQYQIEVINSLLKERIELTATGQALITIERQHRHVVAQLGLHPQVLSLPDEKPKPFTEPRPPTLREEPTNGFKKVAMVSKVVGNSIGLAAGITSLIVCVLTGPIGWLVGGAFAAGIGANIGGIVQNAKEIEIEKQRAKDSKQRVQQQKRKDAAWLQRYEAHQENVAQWETQERAHEDSLYACQQWSNRKKECDQIALKLERTKEIYTGIEQRRQTIQSNSAKTKGTCIQKTHQLEKDIQRLSDTFSHLSQLLGKLTSLKATLTIKDLLIERQVFIEMFSANLKKLQEDSLAKTLYPSVFIKAEEVLAVLQREQIKFSNLAISIEEVGAPPKLHFDLFKPQRVTQPTDSAIQTLSAMPLI
jgi:hypothetical protein